ncbi:uncharacterized protein LOC125867186 [Solanum stenotomum]|uniref:uncharacterized protein LOC125867186 n=1 Tax=Solanum stenotomum TaxID=172797 RepID=UPI0020D09DA1|nr:uncharacterized protein LOC125867186 [Solanum stenotomum]
MGVGCRCCVKDGLGRQLQGRLYKRDHLALPGGITGPWKQVWRCNIPAKVKRFPWLVCIRACLTQEKLKRRRVQSVSRCFFYNEKKAAISATWLFFSAIPTLLAFRRAAESLEKLMDVTREELPDTMAAVRLSGMEISDLTMELSDIGQGLTQGVRSSTRAVRLAEERLRQFSSTPQSATVQGLLVPMETRTAGPALAKKARDLREGIVKGRQVLQMLFTLTRYSRTVFNFFKSREKT